jgi:outer membrane protein TolC
MIRIKKIILAFCLAILASPSRALDQDQPMSLSIKQAIGMAIENNLAAKLSKAQTLESRGRVLAGASALLPQIIGTLSENRTYKLNLAALGFQPGFAPGFPSAIGPFNVFDARFHLVENILNLSSIKSLKAARVGNRMAMLGESLASEQVAAAAALSYIDDLRAQKEIFAAHADEELALELLKLAKDRVNSGTADPIDLARAQTSSSQAHLRWIVADLSAKKSDMRLKHIIGIALGQPIILQENLSIISRDNPNLQESLANAFSNRLEVKIEKKSLEAARLTLSAARFERAPSISINGDYGLSGITPTKDDIPTGDLGAGLTWRFFSGGQIRSQTEEAHAQMERAQAELDDVTVQVEQDIRTSILDLKAAEEEVETSSQTETLAWLELKLAKNRFKAGIGDNQELVRAQDQMADARNAVVGATAEDNNAWINLFLGLGKAREFKILDDDSRHSGNP